MRLNWFYWVLLFFASFPKASQVSYKVFSYFTAFYLVLSGFIRFYWVSLGFHWVLLFFFNDNVIYLVLPSFAKLHRVFLVFESSFVSFSSFCFASRSFFNDERTPICKAANRPKAKAKGVAEDRRPIKSSASKGSSSRACVLCPHNAGRLIQSPNDFATNTPPSLLSSIPFFSLYWFFFSFFLSFFLSFLFSFTEFQRTGLGFTGLNRILFAFYWVLLKFTGFYWVLLGFTGIDWVVLGFHRFYLVLLRFTELN